MKSKFEIITPASDLAILTPQELRAAINLSPTDTSQDAILAPLGLEAAEWVAELCGVRTAGKHPPTFLAEDVRETFYKTAHVHKPTLILSRRFVTVTSLTENGVPLTEGTDFVVDDDGGIIERYIAGYPARWLYGTIVVEYTAGFNSGSPSTDVPSIIKSVMSDYIQFQRSNQIHDPLVRSETTVDLDSVTYQNITSQWGAFDDAARNKLARFITGRGFA